MSQAAGTLSWMSQGRHDEAMARLGEHQHGVVHRTQAARVGLTPRMIATRVRTGRLVWATTTVLRIGGAPSSWHQRVMTAVLDAGTGSVASHRCAAQLRRLDAFGDRGRRWVEVTSTVHRQRRSAIRHTSTDLDAVDIGRVAGIPCTTVTRTLCDLGAVVPSSRLEHAVDGALRDGLTDVPTLWSTLTRVRRRGRAGVAALEEVLVSRGHVVPTSVLERMLLRTLRAHGLPEPIAQLHVVRPDGSDAYLDFAYPDLRIAIEVDGHSSHATRWQRASDARRSNQLALGGWTVLRFTYEDVRDRSNIVMQTIRRARGAGSTRVS